MSTARDSDRRLHPVFGCELVSFEGVRFRDVKDLDIVGVLADYASAHAAWMAEATADQVQTR